MLPDDILVNVFSEADLESCVALSHVTTSSYAVWTALDPTVVRSKVLERVPWFSLGTDFSSWAKCALAVVSRTRRALAAEYASDLDEDLGDRDVLIKTMAVPLSLSRNNVVEVSSVDISRITAERRLSLNPLFPDQRIQTTVGKYAVWEGTKLLSTKNALDLSTMDISKSDYDRWTRPKPPTLTNTAVSCSGVQVRNLDPNGTVEVLSENETFVLARISTSHGPAVQLFLTTSRKHEVDPEKESSLRLYKEDHNETGMINLLPVRGALMYKLCDDIFTAKSQLLYVDATTISTRLAICELPRFQQEVPFYSDYQQFFVSYDGYLFLFYEGRFQRLWVDLGFTTPYKTALCSWNQSFPAIGSILDSRQAVMEEGMEFRIMQGHRELNRRYVGIRGTGRIVGDLKTGKTYFAKDAATADQFGIPFVNDEDALGFYTCEKRIMDVLETRFGEVIDGKSNDTSLAAFFEHLCRKDVEGKLKRAKKLKKMQRRRTKKDLGKDELNLNNQWHVDDYYRDFDWPLELNRSVSKPGEFKRVSD